MSHIDLQNGIDYRNLGADFKGMTNEQIMQALDQRRGDMITVLQNLTHDFNKATAVRNHNAFSGREIVFLNPDNPMDSDNPEGAKKWNKTGAVGAQHYEHISHHRILDYQKLFDRWHEEGYTIYAVDNTPGYELHNVFQVKFPKKSVFLFGEEQIGLADELIQTADQMIYIPQTGSVRSLNVSVAHGIIAALYTAQYPVPEDK
ncbi:TrmH family RNA methyltransferase [Weissella paramesenteroides]|uniref:TrmH family RNA methyltransferase n=1 Tax=Weissella paramesenteroides TaxID=1249 RepID=UPI00223B285C|nr:TrmH family RNA methyltransferase [Weissella paramesenteroides]MCS9985360.1 TrmH family RNA methyltransferase [Weissella paramesenteroides]MCS9998240.1 TrmH family RNA methyltransferase [Weissella paramesenteroides]MCT0259805.1 TrmH family RNA methyltransferase [Weissella paramesenteroides]